MCGESSFVTTLFHHCLSTLWSLKCTSISPGAWREAQLAYGFIGAFHTEANLSARRQWPMKYGDKTGISMMMMMMSDMICTLFTSYVCRGVLYINCHRIPPVDNVEQWFRRALKIPSACDEVPAVEYLAPGAPLALDLESANPIDATVILDHFDHVIQMANWENFLLSYAHNAFETRRFNFMLCVTSEAHVSRIVRLNGGRKFQYLGLGIENYGKWFEPQVSAFMEKLTNQTTSMQVTISFTPLHASFY